LSAETEFIAVIHTSELQQALELSLSSLGYRLVQFQSLTEANERLIGEHGFVLILESGPSTTAEDIKAASELRWKWRNDSRWATIFVVSKDRLKDVEIDQWLNLGVNEFFFSPLHYRLIESKLRMYLEWHKAEKARIESEMILSSFIELTSDAVLPKI
jgi:hypothetical protein